MMMNQSYEQACEPAAQRRFATCHQRRAVWHRPDPDPARQRRRNGWRLPQRSPSGTECEHQRSGLSEVAGSLRPDLHGRRHRDHLDRSRLRIRRLSATMAIRPSSRLVVDTTNQVPYVVCTTCHNQHQMNVYLSSASSPIAGNVDRQLCHVLLRQRSLQPGRSLDSDSGSFDHAVLPAVPLWRSERGFRRHSRRNRVLIVRLL